MNRTMVVAHLVLAVMLLVSMWYLVSWQSAASSVAGVLVGYLIMEWMFGGKRERKLRNHRSNQN